MANILRVQDTDSYITWVKTNNTLNLTLRKKDGTPIAKAKLTSEQLHTYICMHNTMK